MCGEPAPGEAFGGDDDEACSVLFSTMEAAARQAPEFDLDPLCEVTRDDLAYGGTARPSQYQDAWDDCDVDGAGDDWPDDMNWLMLMKVRIRLSYEKKAEGLCWCFDKLSIQALCDEVARTSISPSFVAAWRGRESPNEEDLASVEKAVSENRPIVVKPTHGSESIALSIFPSPTSSGGLSTVVKAIREACRSRAHRSEPWMLSHVDQGVIVQDLYDSGDAACPMSVAPFACPLELKVQTLFGKFLFGTVRAYPWQVIVMPDGTVHRWSSSRVVQNVGYPKSWRNTWGTSVPDKPLEGLRRILAKDWSTISNLTEKIARASKLDEVRVDWLLGDERFGPRVVELQYIGAGGNLRPELRPVMCRTFLMGHKLRSLARRDSLPTISDG